MSSLVEDLEAHMGKAEQTDLLRDVHRAAKEIRRLYTALATARREGAEQMRERAKAIAEDEAQLGADGDGELYVARSIADRIAALPLENEPGDAS